jgi:3-oxoadipate enol-lactonase
MNLHTREAGPPDAPAGTVVFLHGFPLDGSMWEPQLDALPDGWRGIAPDLRGFGDTRLDALPGQVSTGKRIGSGVARDSEPVLTMARLADDVASLIADRAGGRAVVCGLSMGGYVAFELWRRHPERVRALVLADTRAGADGDEAREGRLRMAQTARSAGARAIATAMTPALVAASAMDRVPETVGKVKAMILGTSVETLIAALAGMLARHDSTGALGGITVPTLVITGEEDAITPPDEARAMAAAIPGASFVAVPGAGHLSNLERPAAFNDALCSFLLGLPTTSGAL